MNEKLSRKWVKEVTIKSGVTLNDLKELAAEAGTGVHKSKIYRTLHKTDIYVKVTRRELYLKKNHMKACLAFVNRHLNELPDFWKHVLLSDKTNITLWSEF